MFGMGSTMQISDFQEVLKSPKAVALGVFFQFSIMPLLGWGLTKVFDFPSEIFGWNYLGGLYAMWLGFQRNVVFGQGQRGAFPDPHFHRHLYCTSINPDFNEKFSGPVNRKST